MQTTSSYRLLAEEALAGAKYGERAPEALYAPVEYALTAGGKRLRPVILLMACEAFGGDPEKWGNVAAGLEMFHNFTLLHDDVMDSSELRRGRPTVHARWDVNTAILSGDAMLTLATQLVAGVPDHLLREVLDRFNRMAMDVYEGQRLDMDFEKAERVDMDEYLHMIELKTGALLGAAAAIGALLGGASTKQADCMDTYGRALGLAFQVQDDYLDMFGDAATFGKPIGGDVLNGKKTYLAVEAASRDGSDAEALKQALCLPPNDTKIRTVRHIYERMGLEEQTRREVAHLSGRALKALKKSGMDADGYEAFRKLTDKMTGRKN